MQLALATLPAAAQARLGSKGLIQLFYCVNGDPLCEVDCEAYVPFGASTLARFIADTSGPAAAIQPPAEAFSPGVIVGWTPSGELPNHEERGNLGIELSEEAEEALAEWEPREGDKLGGWPLWIQGVEYPDCPTCGTRMELVFQLDSEVNVPHMFGDVGIGHLTRCPAHREVLGFGWACG